MTSTKVLVNVFFGAGRVARIGPMSSVCHHRGRRRHVQMVDTVALVAG
jgi:hypothetical protein